MWCLCESSSKALLKSSRVHSICFPLSIDFSFTSSLMVMRNCVSQDLFFRKPNWWSVRILWWSRCDIRLRQMMCSIIFEQMHVSETSPGWKWDTNIRTWIEVRHNMAVVGTLIWGTCMGVRCEYGGWIWDTNLMEEISESMDLDGGEAVNGWRWDKNLVTWISLKQDLGLRWCLGGAEMQFVGTGMQVRHNLVVVQREIYRTGFKWPEWRGDVNLGA